MRLLRLQPELALRIPKQRPEAPEKIHIKVNRSAGPTTIEAAKGVGYREVKSGPAAKRAPKPAKKRAPGQ